MQNSFRIQTSTRKLTAEILPELIKPWKRVYGMLNFWRCLLFIFVHWRQNACGGIAEEVAFGKKLSLFFHIFVRAVEHLIMLLLMHNKNR